MTTQEAMTNPVLRIVDALIDGFRITDPQLHDRCRPALCAIGGRVLPRLNEVAEDPSTTAWHRSRLRKIIDRIPPQEGLAANVAQLITKALVDGLRPLDDRLHDKVMTALRQLSPSIATNLLAAAAGKQVAPEHCCRLLRAVEQLGHPPSGSDQIIVMLLSWQSPDPLIREEAARLLDRPTELQRAAAAKYREGQQSEPDMPAEPHSLGNRPVRLSTRKPMSRSHS